VRFLVRFLKRRSVLCWRHENLTSHPGLMLFRMSGSHVQLPPTAPHPLPSFLLCVTPSHPFYRHPGSRFTRRLSISVYDRANITRNHCRARLARNSDTSCAQSCLGCILVTVVSTRGSQESLECSNSYDICLASPVLLFLIANYGRSCILASSFAHLFPCVVSCAVLDRVRGSEFNGSHQRRSKGALSSKVCSPVTNRMRAQTAMVK
jgi:hypothetical protein